MFIQILLGCLFTFATASTVYLYSQGYTWGDFSLKKLWEERIIKAQPKKLNKEGTNDAFDDSCERFFRPSR